jgi:hypothetical protein
MTPFLSVRFLLSEPRILEASSKDLESSEYNSESFSKVSSLGREEDVILSTATESSL